MTDAEKARLAALNKMPIMSLAESEERRRLQALDELDHLGPEGVAAKRREEEARRAAHQAERAERKRQEAATLQALQQLRPLWAQALIMATYEDHDARRCVALTWSAHTRDLFPELHAAALLLPETAHLGPGREETYQALVDLESYYKKGYTSARRRLHEWLYSLDKDSPFVAYPTYPTRAEAEAFVQTAPQPPREFRWTVRRECQLEHREKFTGGSGYYLHAFGSHWRVRKEPWSWLGQYPEVIELDRLTASEEVAS